jgi:MFS family permease
VSPISSYRTLLQLAGPTYVLVAFIGRLPLAMSQLGTLLLVATATGSYGLGGLSAGALAVSNAVGAPVAGTFADRIGQRHVVLVQSLLGATGLALLVAVVHAGAADALVVLTAGATGLVLPQVGPLARVRWRPLTRATGAHQRRLVDAAFSYEGAADEASFAIGPALVGLSVAAFSPEGALLLAALLLAERVVPSSRVGTAMTMLASATGVGYALGSSIAGRLADESGATAAFGVTVGATVLAVGLMTSQQARLRVATVDETVPVAFTPVRA